LDNAIQDLLDDSEYTADVEMCEEYIDYAKRDVAETCQQSGELATGVHDREWATPKGGHQQGDF
jgi:hypothetical protein